MGEAQHVTIERWLETLCAQLGPGAHLPTEMETAERFGVSRMTARKAYERLVERGRIERRRGVGTIVMPDAVRRDEGILRPFSDEIRRRGMTPTSRLVRAEVTPDTEAATNLDLPPQTPVVQVDRVRCADGVPVAFERTTLLPSLADALGADLATTSLHRALSELGHVPSRAQGHVVARLADAVEAELLEVDQPCALLVEDRIVTDTAGRPIEHTRTAYVGARWVLDTGALVTPPAPLAPS